MSCMTILVAMSCVSLSAITPVLPCIFLHRATWSGKVRWLGMRTYPGLNGTQISSIGVSFDSMLTTEKEEVSQLTRLPLENVLVEKATE